MWTVDFETEGIESRPEYPPVPVGVSIKKDDNQSEYLAWGHPTENNCTLEEATEKLREIWEEPTPKAFHNMKFDLDVAETHLGLEPPPQHYLHDTQFLVYLYDVQAKRFGLKPSAERILDWPPEEQDAIRDWILANVPGTSTSKKNEHYWAKYICLTPGKLCGQYAGGDTDRTYGLFVFIMEYMKANQMLDPYRRELDLVPYLLRAERTGIRVAMGKLEVDRDIYNREFARADEEIFETLGCEPFNINSGAQLVQALDNSGMVDIADLPRTKTGKVSTAREALVNAVHHPRLLGLLQYRGVLKTCLGTFIEPWLHQANANGGRLHGTWHQTRGEADKGGTVTGRLSCAHPNLMNIPNPQESSNLEGYAYLPRMRAYLLAEMGHLWVKRDYSAQEVRIMAHFEDGPLMLAFQANPHLDPHQFGMDMILERTGIQLERNDLKAVVFSILYGSGVKALAKSLGVSYPMAASIKEAYLNSFPEVRALIADVKSLGDAGKPVRTTGGRILYAEKPMGGRSFAYKLFNHMAQGSASDVSKQGLINYERAKDPACVFMAQVHDENNYSMPEDIWEAQAELLGECMADVKLDVPLTSSLYVGKTWQEADNNKVAA